MLPNFLSAQSCNDLLSDCQQRRAEFVAAAVGRGSNRQQLNDQRRDETLWLSDRIDVQRAYLQSMDTLRCEINRRLFLGLRDCEAHYAHYSLGGFYRRHRDAFANTPSTNSAPQRTLSSVIYLNGCAGGELVLWRDELQEDESELARIAPVAGTAVFFLSAEFPHEVLPAQSDRYSIATWFRA